MTKRIWQLAVCTRRKDVCNSPFAARTRVFVHQLRGALSTLLAQWVTSISRLGLPLRSESSAIPNDLLPLSQPPGPALGWLLAHKAQRPTILLFPADSRIPATNRRVLCSLPLPAPRRCRAWLCCGHSCDLAMPGRRLYSG